MKVIICGAGQVGFNIARYLASENADITVIDQSRALIEKISDSKSKLTYVFHSDTGGSIPKWMINQVLIKSPKKSIMNIRRIAESK